VGRRDCHRSAVRKKLWPRGAIPTIPEEGPLRRAGREEELPVFLLSSAVSMSSCAAAG
jgi:hypothetical protein